MGVSVVDGTSIDGRHLLGVELRGVPSVNEHRLANPEGTAVVGPKRNPLHSTLLEMKVLLYIESPLQGWELLHHELRPEFMISLDEYVPNIPVLLAKNSELPVENLVSGVVVFAETHHLGVARLPLIPVRDTVQVHKITEVDTPIKAVVGHVGFYCFEGFLVLVWYLMVRQNNPCLHFHFSSC